MKATLREFKQELGKWLIHYGFCHKLDQIWTPPNELGSDPPECVGVLFADDDDFRDMMHEAEYRHLKRDLSRLCERYRMYLVRECEYKWRIYDSFDAMIRAENLPF